MLSAKEVMKVSPIIPVLAIEDASKVLDIAKALQEGGVNIMEITLRTDAAYEAIETVAKELPSMCVGAGTVVSVKQYKEVKKRGAQFIISPGVNERLLEYSKDSAIAYIPGVASASDIMLAMEFGLHELKLFPANIVGGSKAIKAFGGPFSGISFCPTGGVNLENLREYIQLDNVICVGGTWFCAKELIDNEDYKRITALCKEAIEVINET